MPRNKDDGRPGSQGILEFEYEFEDDEDEVIDDSAGPDEPYLEGYDLQNGGDLDRLVEFFIDDLEGGYFQIWEAVLIQEGGGKLTKSQKQRLAELISFGDDDDVPIKEVDGRGRPDSPWYEILRTMAPHLRQHPLKTFECYHESQLDGWGNICEALVEHGKDLPLPPGIERPVDVIGAPLRNELDLHDAAGVLVGLGQAPEINLTTEHDRQRIADFIANLSCYPGSVEALGLTLRTLRERIILSAEDQPRFEAMLMEALSLASEDDPIAPSLPPPPTDEPS